MSALRAFGLAMVVLAAAVAGCGGDDGSSAVPGGDAARAPELVEHYGCGSCHTIAGIEAATAEIGPPLENVEERLYIAGELPNTPENLVRWIMHPQAVEPGTLMPEMGVSRQDALDLTAYLYGH